MKCQLPVRKKILAGGNWGGQPLQGSRSLWEGKRGRRLLVSKKILAAAWLRLSSCFLFCSWRLEAELAALASEANGGRGSNEKLTWSKVF